MRVDKGMRANLLYIIINIAVRKKIPSTKRECSFTVFQMILQVHNRFRLRWNNFGILIDHRGIFPGKYRHAYSADKTERVEQDSLLEKNNQHKQNCDK